MTVAVASVQRNRAPWIVEWLAFHLMVGFDRIYLYCHLCDDATEAIALKLARDYPITVYRIGAMDEPAQLVAYQHAWNTHQAQVDWMAFIDGDEFLFPTKDAGMPQALARYRDHPLSALAVYWICYGGNGHVSDPGGLLLEQFPRHSAPDFEPNRHVKLIVRGGQSMQVLGAHLFATPNGTYDEQLRPIETSMLKDPAMEPSYEFFRINHYVTQHYDYFKQVKQNIGSIAGNPRPLRPDDWFTTHDRNECDDGVARRLLPALKAKVAEMQARLG